MTVFQNISSVVLQGWGLKRWMGLDALVVITTRWEPRNGTGWVLNQTFIPLGWQPACLYGIVNVLKYQSGKTRQPLLNPPVVLV